MFFFVEGLRSPVQSCCRVGFRLRHNLRPISGSWVFAAHMPTLYSVQSNFAVSSCLLVYSYLLHNLLRTYLLIVHETLFFLHTYQVRSFFFRFSTCRQPFRRHSSRFNFQTSQSGVRQGGRDKKNSEDPPQTNQQPNTRSRCALVAL